MVTVFQLGTIFGLTGMVFCLAKELRGNRVFLKDNAENLWTMKTQRVGRARKTIRHVLIRRNQLHDFAYLQEGTFIMGNGVFDDVYIDSSGGRVKIYLNVQKDMVWITVLKGSVIYQNQVFGKNKREIIKLSDAAKITIDDVMLQFYKRQVI